MGNLYKISKHKLVVKILTLLLMLFFTNSWGQAIFTNPITGTNPNTSNPYTTGQTTDASITVSGIGRGTGITGASANDRYNATGWNSGTLDVNDYFEFTLNPCVGGYINFVSFVYTGQASGTGPLNFAFRSSLDGYTANIGTPNATGTTISLSGAAYQNITSSITFRLYGWGASASGGTWSINDFTFNGIASCTPPCTAPTTTITPTTQTLCAGTATAISVTSSAAINTYTWQASANGTTGWANVVNGTPAGASYSGQGTATLSVTAGSTYYYQCLVTDVTASCTATSATSTLVVNTSPTITTQPINKTICSGSNASFTVASSGSPLTYQWQEKVGAGAFTNITNGGVYSGATSTTLLLTNPGTGMSTNQYQCIVSVASCSSVTTTAVALTVNTTPAAPPAPSAPSNPVCTTGTLSAMSSTVAGVNWYWQGTTAAGTSTTQSTATDYTFSTSNAYYIRALDASGTCWSSSASTLVTVNTAPTVTLAAVSKTVCSGTTVTFTTAASGTSPTYQWQLNSGAGFGDISGATTKTLTLASVTSSMNSYTYQCVITVTGCSTISTSPYVLTVNTTPAAPPAPTVPSNPACTTGTFSAMTSTVAGVSWYWETTSAGTSTAQSTTSNYTTASTATVYVKALDASGTCWSTSANASVTVNQPDLITSGAGNSGICSETPTSFVVTGLSASTPKKWQVSTDNGITFNDVVAGAFYSGSLTNSTINLINVPVTFNGYQYQCVVSVPGCPVVTSTVGILTVTQTPSAPPTPTSLANPACSSTSLSAMSSTVAGVTWYWQGTSSAGTSTTNPTTSDYNVSATGTYYVRARADGSSCLSTSSSTAITINTPPTITTNPSDRTQCVGTNTTFVVAATGSGLTYQWQISTGGAFSNLSNGAPYSNVTTASLSLTGITAGMNGYQYQCVVSGASPCAAATSSFATLIITASGTPATPASSPITSGIACNGFNLAWTSGSGSNRLVVVSTSPIAGNPVDGTSYTANSNYGSGGTIAAGEYVVYKGTGSSIYITALSASTTYYYKIFEFNGCSLNYLTSGTVPNGNATTTSCSSAAGITGVYIDACPGGCGWEGSNELIWATSGSYGFNVSNNGPTLHYDGAPSPPTTIKISTYTQNASNVTALNNAVGACGSTTFVDPNIQGYIPANSRILIANNCMCIPSAYDMSNLCGSGPIYVIFGTNAAWPCGTTGGIFGNYSSGGTVKYFDLDMTAWGLAMDPIYNYTVGSLTGGGNGDVIYTNPAGGPATTYTNSTCKVPLIILPIELVDFYATKNNKLNDIIWKVNEEVNLEYYIIEKSNDGYHFEEMDKVYPNSSSSSVKSYNVIDETPYDDITYYRLSAVEKNGKLNYYKIISVDEKTTNWTLIHYQEQQNLFFEFKNSVPKNSTINLFDISGKLLLDEPVKSFKTVINTQNFAEGIYFIKIETPYKTENFKLIISK